jgi:membrane-associated phospholipid phosphatase
VITIFFILVFVLRLFFVKKDHTNWDVSDRKKRFMPLLLLVVFFGVQYNLVRTTIGSEVLSTLFWLFFLWNIGFFLITLKVKLSGHLSILTLAICQSIAWYGASAIAFLLLIPLLMWSRVYLKRHTAQESVIGIAYAGVVFLLSATIIGKP